MAANSTLADDINISSVHLFQRFSVFTSSSVGAQLERKHHQHLRSSSTAAQPQHSATVTARAFAAASFSNASRDQRISVSAYQCISLSAYQRISVSAYQRISVSAYQLISVSAYQRISVSAYQRISVSAYQRISHYTAAVAAAFIFIICTAALALSIGVSHVASAAAA